MIIGGRQLAKWRKLVGNFREQTQNRVSIFVELTLIIKNFKEWKPLCLRLG